MILLDNLEIDDRVMLHLGGADRVKEYAPLYEDMTKTSGRHLSIWPFVLADWMCQSMQHKGPQSGSPEMDFVFAEAIADCRLQIGLITRERQMPWNIKPTQEFPKMYKWGYVT